MGQCTDDGGTTWKPINRGLRSQHIPDPNPEVGHCVHRIAMHPSRPSVLFMQKHWDVMRSDDAGESWREVSGNLPSDFASRSKRHWFSPPHSAPAKLYTWSEGVHYAAHALFCSLTIE